MRVGEISQLLALRHADDVFVTECKVGPSHSGGVPRLDAWAMRCSWTRPCMFGYEIKVSRSDFLGDNKWHTYLPWCNQLFFVTPWALVQPAEVPGNCGLLWATRSLSRLVQKKKAAHRKIEEPNDLYRYVLMRFLGGPHRESELARWKRIVAKGQEAKEVGWAASVLIAKRADCDIAAIQNENTRLTSENEKLQKAKAILESLGINSQGYVYDLRRRIEEQVAMIGGQQLANQLRDISKKCANAAEELLGDAKKCSKPSPNVVKRKRAKRSDKH